jgi:carbon-monoxide dehydrogenase small subunit
MRVVLTLNGEERAADVRPLSSLLTALRDDFGLPGAKNACEQGECGSCSVLMEGRLVCACLVLAAQADGRVVETVEGLGTEEAPHALQAALVETGAVQCGYCTPGFVVAAADLLARVPDPTDGEIREALSGNLCRCTGYTAIVAAVRRAAAGGSGA